METIAADGSCIQKNVVTYCTASLIIVQTEGYTLAIHTPVRS